MATEPAIVQGRGRGADGVNVVALFIEDANGDLLDIEHLCSTCAFSSPRVDSRPLPLPGYDWPDYDSHCCECGVLVNEGRLNG